MVNLDDEQHYENQQILHQLLSEAPNDAVKKVIKLYNYDNEGTVIYKDMLKSAKKDLQSTAEFLLQIQIEEQVKSKLVSAIIKRIDSLLLEQCQKCENFYKIDREDVPTITCQNCGQGVHEPCYKDLSRTISAYPGIVYICANCISPGSKSSTQSQPNEENIQLTQNSQSDQENVQIHLPPRPNPDNQESHSQLPFSPDDENNDRPLCQLYKRGACPPGITGLRKINGRICNSAHPKRCQKWCQYGDDQEMGCSEGRDCERFHPILCKFSLKFKLCTNRSCKFNHVKGTRRYRPRAEDQQAEQNSNSYTAEQGRFPPNPHASTRTENKSFHNPVWDRRTSQQIQKPVKVWDNQNVPENSENIQLSFLEEIKTQMREMQKEIREMKENYRSQPIPFLPNPLLNLHQNPHHPHLAQIQQNLQPNLPQVMQQMSSLPTPPKGPQNPQSTEVSQKPPTQQLMHQNQVFQSQI